MAAISCMEIIKMQNRVIHGQKLHPQNVLLINLQDSKSGPLPAWITDSELNQKEKRVEVYVA